MKKQPGADLAFSEENTNEALSTLHFRLKDAGLTIAVAESCTAGMLGSLLTRHDGSSSYFLGGFITYSNEAKIALLDVKPDLLIEKGAVSCEVAESMAEGARAKLGSSFALSITGVAGPGGGSEEKPVGTVCIGIAGEKIKTRAIHHYFKKAALSNLTPEQKRDEIRKLSCFSALQLLNDELCT